MSSPIAIPRVTVESTDATTHSPSTSPKYVPVHRRQASDASTRSISPVSSRAPSPTPSDTSSWRSHAPASPQGRRFATKAFANHHNHQHVKADLPHTNIPNHIPQSSSIPSTTNTNNIPFVYSISDLLSLSSSPACLPPSQLQTFAEVVSLLSLPINNDKAAVRRRRNGRRNNSSKSAKNAKDAPVEVRRTRHGHDTWGWQTQHQGDELQVPWRHEQSTPVTVVV